MAVKNVRMARYHDRKGPDDFSSIERPCLSGWNHLGFVIADKIEEWTPTLSPSPTTQITTTLEFRPIGLPKTVQ